MFNSRTKNPGPGPLSFPNPSRSYDETGHGVRFWGYDRTFEIAFLVDLRALAKLGSSKGADEARQLDTFDVNLDRIRTAAGHVYARSRSSSRGFAYTLTDSDF